MIKHFFADLSFFLLLCQFLFTRIFSEDLPHLLPELGLDGNDGDGNDDIEQISYDLFKDNVSEQVYRWWEQDIWKDHVSNVAENKDNTQYREETVSGWKAVYSD